jgi:hypothetical protein
MIKNLEKYPVVSEARFTKDELVNYERMIADHIFNLAFSLSCTN